MDKPGPRGLYRIAEGRFWWVPPGDEPEPVPLSNFTALARRVIDDDAIRFEVEVDGPQGRSVIVVSEAELASLRWTARVPGLAVSPGAQAHLRAAISLHSAELAEVRVATRLGWHEVGGRQVYVHGQGVVGDASGLRVDLPPPLDGFALPSSPGHPTAILDLLDLGPDEVTVPLVGGIVRSILGEPRFCLSIVGPTGTGKTMTAQVAQSFFGCTTPAGSWSSTPNFNTWLCAEAAGTIVIDDFVPGDTAQGSAAVLDQVLRAAGNGLGRGRLGSAAKAPRALVVSTAEALPATGVASLIARMIVLRLQPDDLDWDRLTYLQESSERNTAWTRAFIEWCAPQLDDLRRRVAGFTQELRPRFKEFEVHARTVDALAELGASWLILTEYLLDAGAVDRGRARTLVARAQAALDRAAHVQALIQLAGDPAKLFTVVLHELVSAGTVTVTRDGSAKPTGAVVGWLRDREVLLDPGAALDAVQAALGSDHGLDLSERQIGAALRRAGFLQRVDSRGGALRFTVRARIGGTRRPVWVMAPDAILGPSGPTAGAGARGATSGRGAG